MRFIYIVVLQVTGFISRIQTFSTGSANTELEHLCALGMLVQFESLLSTQGHELGMLADMYVSVCCISTAVYYKFSYSFCCVCFLMH